MKEIIDSCQENNLDFPEFDLPSGNEGSLLSDLTSFMEQSNADGTVETIAHTFRRKKQSDLGAYRFRAEVIELQHFFDEKGMYVLDSRTSIALLGQQTGQPEIRFGVASITPTDHLEQYTFPGRPKNTCTLPEDAPDSFAIVQIQGPSKKGTWKDALASERYPAALDLRSKIITDQALVTILKRFGETSGRRVGILAASRNIWRDRANLEQLQRRYDETARAMGAWIDPENIHWLKFSKTEDFPFSSIPLVTTSAKPTLDGATLLSYDIDRSTPL